jgi:hypothetical protein
MPLFKLALQAKNIQEAYKKQKLTTPRGIIYYVVQTNLVKVDGGIVMLLEVSTYYPD